MSTAPRDYPDLHEHLAALEERGLLQRIDRPIDKDAEMHPLVRWQFVGGIDGGGAQGVPVHQYRRRAGRKYDMPVVVGAIAANPRNLQHRHARAARGDPGANGITPSPIRSRRGWSTTRPCHEVVIDGRRRSRRGQRARRLPIPISTPGFDSAPTLTATNVITRDPDTGVQNMGTYRAALKAPDRLVVRMATRVGGAGGYQHYLKYQKRGEADAVRDRARLPALRRLHGAAEAADRRR